jgi:hypothetical protein
MKFSAVQNPNERWLMDLILWFIPSGPRLLLIHQGDLSAASEDNHGIRRRFREPLLAQEGRVFQFKFGPGPAAPAHGFTPSRANILIAATVRCSTRTSTRSKSVWRGSGAI